MQWSGALWYILCSDLEYENIGIKVRYLRYYGYENKITLKHPEALISASLEYVILNNLNECINL